MPSAIPGTRFSRELPPFHVLVGVDLEGFTTNPAERMPRLCESIPRVLETALRRSGLDWEDRRFPQSTGDGFVLGLPAECVPLLLHPFLGELQIVLEEESRALRADDPNLRMRMRVSVHLGPLPYSDGREPSDGVGKPMNDTHRLLDSGPVRRALTLTDPEVTHAVAIISRRVYEDVVEAGFTALRPSELIPVHAQVKQFSEDAWLYVPAPSGDLLSSGFADREPTLSPLDGARCLGTGITPKEGGHIGTRPVPGKEMDLVRARYVEPPGAARLKDLLRARHLVVVAVEPRGRRTTALRLLDELALETGITLGDVVKRWDRPSVGDLPLDTGCGYLLDLNDPATDHPDVAFAEDLHTHAERLVDHGSYLVITVRPELWRECREIAKPFSVDLGLPDPNRVATVHFHGLLTEDTRTASLRSVPPFALPLGTPPAEAVAAAERAFSGPSVPSPERSPSSVFLRVRDPGGGVSEIVLAGTAIRRDEIRIGRPFPGVAPDIEVDCDLVHRDHCRLIRRDARWLLDPRGKNLPLLRRRGDLEPETVDTAVWLENGDEILIRVRPKEGMPDRHWRLEFHDPQHTAGAESMGTESTSKGDEQ
jgi:hypothetical protein